MLLGAFACIPIIECKSSTRLTSEISPYLYEQQKTSNELDNWIDELEQYECRDCPPNYRRIDDNGYYSYSCLQFQLATFKQYYTRYYPEGTDEMNDDDFREKIYSCELQKDIAYKMIEENHNNWKHWQHSVAKRDLGLPPE